MAKNFPNLEKKMYVQIQDAQGIPKKDESKQIHTPRYIIIKLPKVTDKERILKTAKVKQLYM